MAGVAPCAGMTDATVMAVRERPTEAAEKPARIVDILDRFGPLASMHAALDAAGIGTPCGLVGFFPERTVAELQSAIAVARRRFPVLQTRLAWSRGRPVLLPHDPDLAGGLWEHRLTTAPDGVWFHGCWRHAAADGRSMLRFLQAVGAVLGDSASNVAELKGQARGQLQPMPGWLCGFAADRQRSYVRMTQADPAAPYGVSWLVTTATDCDRLLNAATEGGGGFLGPLAAAAVSAYCEQQVGSRGGLVSLNVPIARDDHPALGGFGFGVGSLLMPVRVRPGGGAELSREISERTRRMSDRGFDRDLDRFLGRDPRRHRLFGAIRARSAPDPAVVVSWKGRHELGGGGSVSRTACFAGAPTLHVSAHADRTGLSISVGSRQSAAARGELLQSLAGHLGLNAFDRFELGDIATDVLLGLGPRAAEATQEPISDVSRTRSGL